MARIVPTNGRVMLFKPAVHDFGIVQHDKKQLLTAHVVHVWGEDMVNLVVFDSNGMLHARTSVPIVQDGSPFVASDENGHAEWMPYQKLVAKGEIAPTLHAPESAAS